MASLLFCGAGEPLMTTKRERIEDGWRTFYAEVRAKHWRRDVNPHSPDDALSFGAVCAIQI
jgi:hypothetical protein